MKCAATIILIFVVLLVLGLAFYFIFRSKPPIPPPLGAPGSTEAAIGDFLTRQVNALLTSGALNTIPFKACSVCPPSTLAQINLGPGSPAWFSDQRCLTGVTVAGRCIPCTTGYQAGVNSVRGMDKLRVTAITPRGLQQVDNTFRYYFDLGATVSNVTVYYTAAGGCVDALVGNFNTAFPVPGNVTATVTGSYLTGVYDAPNQSIVFSTHGLVIGQFNIQARELTDWLQGIGAILTGFRLTSASLTQALIGALRSSVGTGLQEVLQDAVFTLPNVVLPVYGLIPSSTTCPQWTTLQACNQQLGCVWDCGVNPARCVAATPPPVGEPTVYTNVTSPPILIITTPTVLSDAIRMSSAGQITAYSLWAGSNIPVNATVRLYVNNRVASEQVVPVEGTSNLQRTVQLTAPIAVSAGDEVTIGGSTNPERYIFIRGTDRQLAYRLEVGPPVWQPPVNTQCS